jgi:hypothetical protein
LKIMQSLNCKHQKLLRFIQTWIKLRSQRPLFKHWSANAHSTLYQLFYSLLNPFALFLSFPLSAFKT